MGIVDEVKDRLDITDLIGRHVHLQKSGRYFKGVCPFHTEKTPSFFVFPDSQRWHCFGCGKGGDRFAEQIAKSRGIPIIIFYPNYKKYGSPAALFIRNGEVAKVSNIIIACVVNPEDGIDKVLGRDKGGTVDTLRKFINRTKKIDLVHLV